MLTNAKLEIPIKVISEANQREHWGAKNRRKKDQQAELLAEWRRAYKTERVALPCRVRFTRIGARKLDSDNLAGAFKGVRDQLAKLLGVDDGDPRIRFEYAQEVIGKFQYAIRIEIEPMAQEVAA